MSDKPYGKRPNSTGSRGGSGSSFNVSGNRSGGKGPRTGPSGSPDSYQKNFDGAGGFKQRTGPSDRPYYKKQDDGRDGFKPRTGPSDRPYYKKQGDGADGFKPRTGPSDRPYYKKQGDGADGFKPRTGPSDRPYYKKQDDGRDGFKPRTGPSDRPYYKKQGDGADGFKPRTGPSDRPYYKKQGDGADGFKPRTGPSDRPYYKKQGDGADGFKPRTGPSDRPYYKKQGDDADGFKPRTGPSDRPYYKKQGDGADGFQQRPGSQDRPYYYKKGGGTGERRTGPSGGSGYNADNREGGFKRSDSPDRAGNKKPYEREDGFQRTDTGRRGAKPWEKGPSAPKNPREEFNAPAQAPLQEDELPYLVMGRNAVREAIRSGRSIDHIYVNAEQDGSLRELVGLARDRNLIIREVDKRKLDEMTLPFGHGGRPANHQGIVAQTPGVEYCDVGDILDVAKERNESPFVILLDGVEDPHNLGSIIRSAECAGAHGIIIPKRRSASVTAAAVKASAGAVEYMKVARVSNIVNAIERLKQENVWIAGAHMQGTPVGKADLRGALALVIGGEGEGLSRLVREKCDFLVSLPVKGQIESLNASVAAAVLMYAKISQDAAKE